MTKRQRKILSALRAIEAEAGDGMVTPQAVVTAAADPDHPLHGEFEWDDGKAAAAYRLDQARKLLRIRVTVEVDERIIAAPIFVRAPEAPADAPGYVSTTRLIGDDERSRQVLIDELSRARRAVERARVVADALDLSALCEQLLADIVSTLAAAAE